MRISMCSIMLIATLSLMACNRQPEGGTASFGPKHLSTSEIRAQLASLDYLDEIAALEIVQTNPVIALNVAGMPDVERRGVMRKRLPNGETWSTADTLIAIHHYYVENGSLPESGVDLFPDLLTANGYEAFLQMSKQDQLLTYRAAINPGTGKFYTTFQPGWNPSGLAFGVPRYTKFTKTQNGRTATHSFGSAEHVSLRTSFTARPRVSSFIATFSGLRSPNQAGKAIGLSTLGLMACQ